MKVGPMSADKVRRDQAREIARPIGLVLLWSQILELTTVFKFDLKVGRKNSHCDTGETVVDVDRFKV